MGYFDDMFGSDDDDHNWQCKGICANGSRCKRTLESQYCAGTIFDTGYCTQHLNQRYGNEPKSNSPKHKKAKSSNYQGDKSHPAIVQAARRGDLDEVFYLPGLVLSRIVVLMFKLMCLSGIRIS